MCRICRIVESERQKTHISIILLRGLRRTAERKFQKQLDTYINILTTIHEISNGEATFPIEALVTTKEVIKQDLVEIQQRILRIRKLLKRKQRCYDRLERFRL